MKNGKRVAIGARPPANPQAEAWVRQGDDAEIGKGDLYTARLTIDVTPALRARIKVAAGEARKTTAAATSTAVAMRPNAISALTLTLKALDN